jgi:hypothetical protein
LALPMGFQLSQHHLWLVEAPPGIVQVVWDVVAMAAVHAMVAGRKHMWSCSFAGAEDPQVCVQAGCAQAKSAFWHSLHISHLCIDTCRVRARMLWVPRILFFLSPASPHAYLFNYLPLTMLLLGALDACISFLLLILLGCKQFCPVCLCSFCFASLRLTVLPLLVGAQLWSLVVSLVLFVLLHALLLFSTCVPQFPFCMLLVFSLNSLYLWFPCSFVALALLFAL